MNGPDESLEAKIRTYSSSHRDSSLRVERTDEPPAFVVYISGALDTETSSELLTFLSAAKKNAKASGSLIVDLSEAKYISSTGIGVLSTSMLEYAHERIPFSLRSVPPKIKALFTLLGLWSFFPVIDAACEKGSDR